MHKKEEIYDKALELFIANGYDQTPLSRIAKELKISKAGLYHYFKSKDELLYAIHDHGLKKDFIPILDTAEKISDPQERIAYFISNFTQKSLTQNAAAKVLIHEVNRLKPKHREKIKTTWRRAYRLIHNAISELEDSGRAEQGINKTFATFAVIGMCTWTFYWFDYDRKESGADLSEAYINILFKGLVKD